MSPRHRGTHPSNTAEPNGRVALLPPKNKSQITFAYASPSELLENPTLPDAPPIERVTILPAFWHVSMPDARKEQLGRFVPGKTGSLTVLQVYVVCRVAHCRVAWAWKRIPENVMEKKKTRTRSRESGHALSVAKEPY